MSHVKVFLEQAVEIAGSLDAKVIERMADELVALRKRRGRLFILGVGGSAANCSHAVNDFRKLAGIEAYAPTDNVAELTARTNDEGWETVFEGWLKVSHANENDALFILSVGGGNKEKNVSANLVYAIDEAKRRGLVVLGIVGKEGGYTHQNGDIVVVVPTVDAGLITPHSEAFQAVIWHCLVSHPKLKLEMNKWEGMESAAAKQ